MKTKKEIYNFGPFAHEVIIGFKGLVDVKLADRDKQDGFILSLWVEFETQMMRESIHCYFNIFGTGMCEQQQLNFEN